MAINRLWCFVWSSYLLDFPFISRHWRYRLL